MTGPPAAFDACMPSPDGVLCFRLTTGGALDHVAAQIRTQGLAEYEAPAPAVIAGLVQEVPGLVLDIGANTGVYALLAAAAHPQARVVAFEPLDPARALLLANIACNPSVAFRIRTEPLALSRARSTAVFYETINDAGLVSTSSSLELSHAAQVGRYVERRAATETLDGWAESAGVEDIALMKIDVEGHEHAVIEGGRGVLARHRPFVVAEFLGPANFAWLNGALAEAGYLDFALYRDGLRRCPSLRFHPEAWNHLLCPAERTGQLAAVCERLGLGFGAGE
ncbi:FkbM family methyltransferase [Roseomonas sp. GCM10028921]